MKAHQQRVLEAGLSEFDRTVRRRRLIRRSAVVTAAAAAAAAAAIMISLGNSLWHPASQSSQPRHGLPVYVELIHTQAQLGAELALAEACERVGFEGSRIYLVDCTPPSGH